MTATNLQSAPRISEQAAEQGFGFGFFDFGKAKTAGVDYFNCGLVRRDDGLWLITRRSQWKKDHFGMNDLVAFHLKDRVPQYGARINIPEVFSGEQWEDPRAVIHNGKVFIACTNFIWTKRGWTGAHQLVAEVDKNWDTVKRFDPVYGHNKPTLVGHQGHEKSWLPFINGDRLHIVYWASPHTVIRLDDNFKVVEEHKTEWDSSVWEHGQMRGGTPPVYHDGKYWTFFHSALPYENKRNQYFMGAYSFDAEAPFSVNAITPFPLLSGSIADGGWPEKPPCVFPCGAIMEDGKWMVTMGVNDLRCAWVEIPHEKLTDQMIEV